MQIVSQVVGVSRTKWMGSVMRDWCPNWCCNIISATGYPWKRIWSSECGVWYSPFDSEVFHLIRLECDREALVKIVQDHDVKYSSVLAHMHKLNIRPSALIYDGIRMFVGRWCLLLQVTLEKIVSVWILRSKQAKKFCSGECDWC